MPSSTVEQILEAMASQIEDTLCGTANPLIPNLQVVADMWFNPTPPSIDIYPAEEFATWLGYGLENVEFSFVVRARVSTADNDGGRDLLKTMMDPRADTSVALALLSERTLGGVIESIDLTGQTGYGLFPSVVDPQGDSLLGATWTFRVYP